MAEAQVVGLLQKSLVPSQGKQAEQALRQLESTAGFSLVLLEIVANPQHDATLRLASALYFKNFIRRNWTTASGEYKLPENEVAAIKQNIITLMTQVQPNLQHQLGEAISVIADSDFWERWDTLVDDLVSRLTADNSDVNNGVLQVAHSIFKRWRPLMASDDLYIEINHVLSKFSQPFLVLLQHTDEAIQAQANDKPALLKTCNTMVLILKLFYDLSCQDLPPAFEENLAGILALLHKYISYDNPLLHSGDDSESGVLEFMKAGIFEALTLYVRKYDDAFGPLVQDHVTSCWNFLTSVGSEQKYDILVSKALQFLTAVAFIPGHATIFGNEDTIRQMVQRVILPNLTLRESDLELFEDEPIEYIRRDLEGSDSDTRRRAATDLVRQLVTHHEEMVTKVVSDQISLHLQEYAKNPQENWKFKDTAVYLFCSIAAKGVATSGHGVTGTNPHVDIFDFFREHIAADLTNASAQPVLQVDAIKFLYVFRSLLSQQHWNQAFPLLVQHLNSSQYVIYTYAAIVVERALALSSESKEPVIPRDDVVSLSKDLLQHLFSIIQKSSEPSKVQENEFLMRCVMRVLIVIRDGVLPILDMVLQNLINITMVIRHNPSNPRFYYYHFEAIGALIRFAAPSNPEKMEKALYEAFVFILQNDVQEFSPYVFQLFAALLETNPSGNLSDYYVDLIPPVLQPVVWESRGNVPALVRLLTAIIPRGVDTITKNNQIQPILGVFQKLVSAKSSEVHGFDLLESVLANFPASALQSYFAPMLQIMMTRLSQSKTEQFTQRFVRFYHFFAARDKEGLGVDVFVGVCDQVQHDVFRQVYTGIILPNTQTLSRFHDKKIAVVGLTKALADSQAFVDRYTKGWALTCEGLLRLLVDPPVLATAQHDDVIQDADADDPSFGVGFTQLNTCRKLVRDPYPEAGPDVKRWVGAYLKDADARHGGRIGRFVGERLNDQQRAVLGALMG